MLPPFFASNSGATPTLLTEMSGLYRPTATDADLDRLYRTSVISYRCANFRADNVSLIHWKIVNQANKELDANHPFSIAFHRHIRSIIKYAELSLCFRGRALLYKKVNVVSQRFEGLQYINFNSYIVDKSSDIGLKGFRITLHQQDKQTIDVAYLYPNQAVYIHLADLVDDFDGSSPMEVAFASAGLDVEIPTSQLAWFQNSTIPPIVVMPDENSMKTPTTQERNQLADLLRRIAKGVLNTGRTVILPSRWEFKELTQRFNELDMDSLTTTGQRNVCLAFDIPVEIIIPSADNYAQVRESKKTWVDGWLVPHAHWLAEELTEQLVHTFDPSYRIEPDFDRVPGLHSDITQRTQYVNAQVQSGYRDLYHAAKETNNNPDPRFRGMYIINGVPTRIEDLDLVSQQMQQAPNMVGSSFMGRTTGGSVAPLKLPNAVGAQSYLPDEVYKELKNFALVVGKKGLDYNFKFNHIPPEIAETGQDLLKQGIDIGTVVNAMKTAYLQPLQEENEPAYISLGLSPQSEQIVKQIQDSLGLTNVKFTNPEQFHITLAYLLNAPHENLVAMANSIQNLASFPIRVMGLTQFPAGEDGFPIVLIVDNSPELKELQQSIVKQLGNSTISNFSIPGNFKAHITLAYSPTMIQLPMIPQEYMLDSGILKVGRDDFQIIHQIIPQKSMGKKKVINWDEFDGIMKEFGNVWLEDYQKKVLDQILQRLHPDIGLHEIQGIMRKYTKDLAHNWIGDAKNPGPLLKISQAGKNEGNRQLELASLGKKSIGLSVDFNILNQEALEFAHKYLPVLISNVNETTLNDTQRAIESWVSTGNPLTDLANSLTKIYLDPARADLISQTESTRLFGESALDRYKRSGVTKCIFETVKTGIDRDPKHIGDVCNKCNYLQNQIFDIMVGVRLKDGTYKWVPIHPGCRCFYRPIVD